MLWCYTNPPPTIIIIIHGPNYVLTSSNASTTSSLLDRSDMTCRSRLESPITSGSANRSVRALYDRRMPSRRSIIFSSMAWSWEEEVVVVVVTPCGTSDDAVGAKAWQFDEERATVAATMAVAAVEKDTMVGGLLANR